MMRIAAIQMSSSSNIRENAAKAREFLHIALEKGANVVAFPEIFLLATQKVGDELALAQTLRGVWVQTLQEWAAEEETWIVAGTLPMKTAGGKKTENTTLVLNPHGEITSRYRKIHLFDAKLASGKSIRESANTKAGSKAVTLRTPYGRWGLSICYDLRFPELYRALSDRGAEVLFAPSAFTVESGKAHWDVLTRARAIENLSYLVAPAQWGEVAGVPRYGHTRIVDPWGRVLAERPEGEGVVWADIDLEALQALRKRFPALSHRRRFR